MKQLFVTLLSCLLPTLLIAQDGYIISGQIHGLSEDSKVYLIDGARRKTIDSGIVKNEKFEFKGTLEEAAHIYLFAGKSNKLADILLDNRLINVTGSQPVYDSVQVSGSEIDKQWKEWYKEDQRIGYLRYRLNLVAQDLKEKRDTLNSTKMDQIVSELMNDRVLLLKRYVKNYGHLPSGAVLPTLCTIQDKLTKSDFMEIYNSLSPSMQQTYFGKEIMELYTKAR